METLKNSLSRIEGRGYKSYKQIEGKYTFPGYQLFIDHAQGDPFAPPSAVRVRIVSSSAQFPADILKTKIQRTAVADYLARRIAQKIRQVSRGVKGTGNSGIIQIDAGNQEVLERTAMMVCDQFVEARIQVGLPAFGRRVNAKGAMTIFFQQLPRIVEQALFFKNTREQELRNHIQVVVNQEYMREKLKELGLVAFICNQSLLPRKSGISDAALSEKSAVLFQSPVTLEVEITLPDGSCVKGMGIPKGVTLIVGGGYHGKSTLLKAIERGVYNHIPGDGREKVVTVHNAVKIRAEDGRFIEKVDISPFISGLPLGKTTGDFSSDDASGSTSQAANIMEALEIGTELLLVDEDTSATNFLVRDERMQALVAKEKEPITPFIDRVRELADKQGVSTILVMGGCGDYFPVADHVIMMDNFVPVNVTEKAKEIVTANPVKRKCEIRKELTHVIHRIPLPESFPKPLRGKPLKIQAKGLYHIRFVKTTIDLLYCEQLVDPSQTRAIAAIFKAGIHSFIDGTHTIQEITEIFQNRVNEKGLDFLFGSGHPHGDYVLPRVVELACAVNRLRGIRMKQKRG